MRDYQWFKGERNPMTLLPLATYGAAAGSFATRVAGANEQHRRGHQGQPEIIRLVVTCLLAEGHLLIEDVPGAGKTSVPRLLRRRSTGGGGGSSSRPDLLPSDVTGVTVFNQGTRQFDFHPGAVFANVVVADEINRASPKTQSALLEVMEERQVTLDGERVPVPRPLWWWPPRIRSRWTAPTGSPRHSSTGSSCGLPSVIPTPRPRAVLINEDGGRRFRSLRPVVTAPRRYT